MKTNESPKTMTSKITSWNDFTMFSYIMSKTISD